VTVVGYDPEGKLFQSPAPGHTFLTLPQHLWIVVPQRLSKLMKVSIGCWCVLVWQCTVRGSGRSSPRRAGMTNGIEPPFVISCVACLSLIL